MKNKSSLFFLFKLLIVCLACWYIYNETFLNKNFTGIKTAVLNIFLSPGSSFIFSFVLLLMFFNWGIEALKWKFLIRKVEPLSFFKSFRATLSGVTASVFTPNRVGEFLGRIFYLDKADKIQGALIAILGSMSQLLVTFICGSISLLFFISFFQPKNLLSDNIFALLVVLVILINIFSLLLFFSTSALSFFLNKFSFLKKLEKYSAVFSFYSPAELLVVLLLSFARYMIFTLQFYFLLKILNVEILFLHSLIIIPMIFLCVTAVPTITPAEIGVREFFALQFIGLVSANSSGIVLSAFSLWLINLAVPALIGTIFIMGRKTNRNTAD